MAPLWHCRQIILPYFQGKKPLNYSSKMSEHYCWKFLMNTWAISLRVHKYGFVLLNRFWTAIDTVFSNPRTANYWKMSKNGVSLKTSLQIRCCIPILNWLYTKPDSQVMTWWQKKEPWFYIYWLRSNNSNKVKNGYHIVIYSVASLDATKKMWWFLACDDFWCWELSNDI